MNSPSTPRRHRLRYLIAAAASLAAGLAILAFASQDWFLRGFMSDVVVVIFLYALVRLLFDARPMHAALGVFALAVGLEIAQYFRVAQRLEVHGIFGVLLGSTFDPLDILAYAIGLGAALVGELRVSSYE